MLDPLLRGVKDRLLDPVARATGPFLHPNDVSALSFAVGAGAVVFAAAGAGGWALGAWLASRLLDGFDGSLARVHGLESDLGGYLDILLDFVLYAAIPIALVVGAGPDPRTQLALAFVLAAFYVNAASWMVLSAILEKRNQGARARGEQTVVAMPDALIGGTETIVFFTAFFLFPGRLTELFTVMAVLVLLSAAQRLVWAVRRLT